MLPFYPASKIILINVGNEVMTSGDQNLMNKLLMMCRSVEKLRSLLFTRWECLKQLERSSSGRFDPSYEDLMKGLLGFNNATASPFAIIPYPYFAYRSDTRPETLAFCLFQSNVDAVYYALSSIGFKSVEIVVVETGWPYKGDDNEVGPSIENAKAYNGNLIAHLRSMAGTPLMSGKAVDTYLFALYDEDLKLRPGFEQSFELFKLDLTVAYDVGLSKSSQDNLDYAYGRGIDCGPIKPGEACFEPNTIASHATYAINLFYQTYDKNPLECDFSQSATLSSNNPNKFPQNTFPCWSH
ncbi:GLUCAN ENDO-13-BETA-GLUCOSIDASE BG1-RELATED-RELATED [Salix viminalis]|uniref:glucan endo-1,3-beta-D-glucosidase n=1 Tax=Salix viminalis TaxID=40686 RepID=A0A9Q0UFI4_SALVM|nr:GLUCAN ENDO-13-BETA-GLUCOSIDASE BG1-RELATED-RELATED [Salix viminalis]